MSRFVAAMAMTGFLLVNGGDDVLAQAPQPQIEHQVDIMILQGAPEAGVVAPPVMAGGPDIDFISMPLGLGGETVTGSPYSAEAVTVVSQTLADGNRISRESKAAVYRDTAGRTRREQGLAIIGGMVGGPEDPQQVHITDPQAGITYILDMRNRTAHKLRVPKIANAQASAPAAGAGAATFNLPLPPPPAGGQGRGVLPKKCLRQFEAAHDRTARADGSSKVSQAEGTRSTTTIPAGQIGNELPLTIVSERWFSPELKVLVDEPSGRSTVRGDDVPADQHRTGRAIARSVRAAAGVHRRGTKRDRWHDDSDAKAMT